MATIKDVAAAAGVSVATASRALNDTGPVSARTQQRVKAAAEQLNYRPSFGAKSLATGRYHTIGVVLPAIDRWFYATVVRAIATVAAEHGLDVVHYSVDDSGTGAYGVIEQYLTRQRLDGIICVSLQLDDRELAALERLHRPVITIGGAIAGRPAVGVDNEALGRRATEHLLGLGHRAIAYIGGELDGQRQFMISAARQAGHVQALTAAGVEVREDWLIGTDYTMKAGRDAAVELLGGVDRPTAIVCAADDLALGVMACAAEMGIRIPEDLSLIGIDNAPAADVFQLTTLDQDVAGQGRRAAEHLCAVLDGQTPLGEEYVTVEPQLKLRSTTRQCGSAS